VSRALYVVLIVAAFAAFILPVAAQHSTTSTATLDSGHSYFPDTELSDNPLMSGMELERFSRTLRDLNEPSLLALAQDKSVTVYRFLLLRSFHQPFSVRLMVAANGTASLSGIYIRPGYGYGPALTVNRETLNITPPDVQTFESLLDKADFWSLGPGRACITCRDGSDWLLEGVQGGRYHVVLRWSPKDGPFREACERLMKLSGVDYSADRFF
jgi:hypothetical protein